MAKKRVDNRTFVEIATDIAPHLGKDIRTTSIYVHKWLQGKASPSRESLEAIYKAGYQLEPFIFGVDGWNKLKGHKNEKAPAV